MLKSGENSPQIKENEKIIDERKTKESESLESLEIIIKETEELKSSLIIPNKKIEENFEKIKKMVKKNKTKIFREKCGSVLVELLYTKIEDKLQKNIGCFLKEKFVDKLVFLEETILGLNEIYQKKKINWCRIFAFYLDLIIHDYMTNIEKRNDFGKNRNQFMKRIEDFFLKEDESFYSKLNVNLIFKEVFNFQNRSIFNDKKMEILKITILFHFSLKFKDLLFLVENQKKGNLSLLAKKYYVLFIKNALADFYRFFSNYFFFIEKKKNLDASKKLSNEDDFKCDNCLGYYQKKNHHLILFQNSKLWCNFCFCTKNKEIFFEENKHIEKEDFFSKKELIFEFVLYEQEFLEFYKKNFQIIKKGNNYKIEIEKSLKEEFFSDFIFFIINHFQKQEENLKTFILFFFTKSNIQKNFKSIISESFLNLCKEFPFLFFHHEIFEAIYYMSLKSEKKTLKLLIQLFAQILKDLEISIFTSNFFLNKTILQIIRNFELTAIMEDISMQKNCIDFFYTLYMKKNLSILDENCMIKNYLKNDELTLVREELIALIMIYEIKELEDDKKKIISNLIKNIIFHDSLANKFKNKSKKKKIYSDIDLLIILHNLNFFIELRPIQNKKKESVYFLYRFFEDNKMELKIIINQLIEFLLTNFENEKKSFFEKVINMYNNEKILKNNDEKVPFKKEQNSGKDQEENSDSGENKKQISEKNISFKNLKIEIKQKDMIIKQKNNIIILLSFLHDTIIIKTNKHLSLITEYLSKILIKKMEKLMETNEAYNFNLTTSKKTFFSIKMQKLNEEIYFITKGLIYSIKNLNGRNYSLFYKKEIVDLSVYLSENLLNFNLKLSKKLTKLKAYLHINFKTFDRVEISLRRNTNFMNLAIDNISNCEKQNNLCILAICKSLGFLHTMLRYLPIKCFNQAFFEILYKFSIKLFQIDNATLIRENLFLLSILYDNLENKKNECFDLVKNLLADRLGFELCLELTEKNKNNEFVTLLWKNNIDYLYANFKQKSSDLNILPKPIDFYIIKILNNFAQKRVIDLFRFYIFIFSGLIHEQKVVIYYTVEIINDLIKIDPRLLNNNLQLEITKNLLNSFTPGFNFKTYFNLDLEKYLLLLDKRTLFFSIQEFSFKTDISDNESYLNNYHYLFLLMIFSRKKFDSKLIIHIQEKLIKKNNNLLLLINSGNEELNLGKKIKKQITLNNSNESIYSEENDNLEVKQKINIEVYRHLLRIFYIIIFINSIIIKELFEENNENLKKDINQKIQKINYLEIGKYLEKKIAEFKIKSIKCFFNFKLFLKKKILALDEIKTKNSLCKEFNIIKQMNIKKVFEKEDLNHQIFDDDEFNIIKMEKNPKIKKNKNIKENNSKIKKRQTMSKKTKSNRRKTII